MHTKFKALQIGHYQIEKVIGFNSYTIRDLDENVLKFPINGNHIKKLFTWCGHGLGFHSYISPPTMYITILSFLVILFLFKWLHVPMEGNWYDFGVPSNLQGVIAPYLELVVDESLCTLMFSMFSSWRRFQNIQNGQVHFMV